MANIEKIPRLRKENRKKRTNRQLLILLLLFFLVLLLVLFFQSSISRVQDISVTGAQLVSPGEVIKQSHLHFDMQYLLVNKEKVATSIVSAIPAIESVEVRKTFPGKIELVVKERPRVAFLMNNRGELYPVTNKGVVLRQYPSSDEMVDKPIIRLWKTEQLLPEFAEQLDKLDPGIRRQISEIRHEPTKNNPDRLILFMKDGFEVHTVIQDFADNMAWYPSFVQSLKREGKTEGIINLSEVKWFEPYKQQQTNGNKQP
ncbi:MULTISPECIES: cell division protein FtsQ/DivIB [Aneurinibacillus]|uniref:Cell division protein DivIB n=1 Tax=Aneurinibacillus thermoaerophilus TaxID=143495 RepID=A0A1G7W8K4_ANETH|nr:MULTISPECIES: FtsQ-type POTRA domain-containing protein [Aneurinibacillus]MED0674719.1 FtsQ-type POTRA domain-containing protein [Aneurinibacillus thermoaerophilus]MED0680202.1 FtsQ-type POTRA domain-containing protein [Aneurinibacillus thermoaerophilus]MED0736849.1 FtsQ-type POTRA domain-containing protein [Aneurinibacillus thermoaerophilus]MED0756690.1 FtsQ-type POTRA domain-containing protein [Aneurinibacillus thermoaerophilus]MED0760740.1 FtsQ-type POTRA domain-containing protein [Aneur